jgi:hypothetical protein
MFRENEESCEKVRKNARDEFAMSKNFYLKLEMAMPTA